jgi:WD40 repeat protein
MPHADELPDPLRPLSSHQAMHIHHESFETEVASLLAQLDEIIPVGPDRDLGQPVSVLDYHGRNPLSANDPDSRQMALSADGRRFAAVTYRSTTAQGEAGGWAAAWDVTTGELVAEFSLAEGASSLGLSPDGGLVAIGTGGLPGVQLRELPTGKDAGQLVYWPVVRWALAVAPVVEVSAVAFNSDARFLATACGLTARVWDVGRRRTKTRVSSGRKRPLSDVALDGPGTRLAAASKGETRLWELPDGRPQGHFPHGRRLAFSADGKRLATAGPDEQAKVWDVGDQSPIASVRHDKEVVDVALSPDGTYLVTGSKDRTVCLWDVDDDGRELVRLGLDTPVRYVAITTDGRQIAAASDALRLWRVPAELADE